MSKIGSIEVTIRIKLDQDVTSEVARKFVEELDYEIKDTTGEVSIVDTEIIGDNLEDEDVIGMDDIPPHDEDFGVDCPGCGDEYTSKDIEGGRCLSCGSMIVAKNH